MPYKAFLCHAAQLCNPDRDLLPGAAAEGVPPVLQTRGLPPALEGLPGAPHSGYRYVLFHLWFITVTRRSLSLAVAASCLTFIALQVLPPIPQCSAHLL